MPNYAVPGVDTGRRRSYLVGLLALALAAALIGSWIGGRSVPDDNRIRIRLYANQIGEGIVSGTTVRLDGVPVGEVETVAAADRDRRLLVLDLDRGQTSGLTDALAVDYAPENLFGISAVALHARPGGAALRDDADIDVSDRIDDVTMSTLLRRLTDVSTRVLTPTLTELLGRVSTDLEAFGPFLQAVVASSRAIADTQRYEPSYLLDQYAGFFGGLGEFSSSTFTLLDSVLGIEVFRNDHAKYDATISLISDEAYPALAGVYSAGAPYNKPLIDMVAPLLAALTRSLPAPANARAELSELIDRLNLSFSDTGGGPALDVAVTLRGVPGVAVPLLGGRAAAETTGPPPPFGQGQPLGQGQGAPR